MGKAPAIPYPVNSLPSSANVLHVSVENVREALNGRKSQVLFASTADWRLSLLGTTGEFTLLKSQDDIHDSPILSCVVLASDGMRTITASMSGKVVLYDHQADRVLSERRDHKKYVVKVAQTRHGGSTWVATAGWDAKVFLYRLQGDVTGDACSLGEPVTSLCLATNPETITFITPLEPGELVLLVTRRDSTSLHYYHCKEKDVISPPAVELLLLGSQNLAPHSNAWIAFRHHHSPYARRIRKS